MQLQLLCAERLLEQQFDDECVESNRQTSLTNIIKSIEEVKGILDLIGELVSLFFHQMYLFCFLDNFIL
jgi:hypothetical protein